MRGRGGRFGGRGGRISATQALIRDNSEDLDLDVFHSNDPPKLFPSISMPQPMALTEEEMFSIAKMREISARFNSSPYYLSRKIKQKDIVRYSDRARNANKEFTLLECINTSVEDATRYIPHELLDGRFLNLVFQLAYILTMFLLQRTRWEVARDSSVPQTKKRGTNDRRA